MNQELSTALQGILVALAQFAQTLLMLGLPILAAYAARWLRVQGKIAWAKLEATQNRALLELINTLARLAVQAAEQEFGGDKGQEKKRAAVQLLSDWLEERGVQLDEAKIYAAVEAAVYSEINAPYLQPNGATPLPPPPATA